MMPILSEWDSFYVIVGSAGGALVGLQFVVLTLIAERPPKDMERAGAAFATPTIVHFGAVLLVAAVLRAPWHTVGPLSLFLAAAGIGGVAYAIFVARMMRRQSAYRPVFEDWLFYVLLPLGAYLGLASSALAATTHLGGALFGVGAAALLLLFVGIHNAWDSVAYHVFVSQEKSDRSGTPRDR